MDAPASVLNEFNGPSVLHAFGALAVDLQDFISDLGRGTKPGREKKGGRVKGKAEEQEETAAGTNDRKEGERREEAMVQTDMTLEKQRGRIDKMTRNYILKSD